MKIIESNPKFALAYYNKACIESLQKKGKQALMSLEKAIGLDSSLKESMKSEVDFKFIKNLEGFKTLIKK